MNDLNKRFTDWGKRARQTPALQVDVRRAVLETIRQPQRASPGDRDIAISVGVLMTITAAVMVCCVSDCLRLLDPWAAFL